MRKFNLLKKLLTVSLLSLCSVALGQENLSQVPPTGPNAPIGQTLKTPEAQKRLEELIARENHERAQAESVIQRNGETKVLKPSEHAFHEHEELKGIPTAFVNLGNTAPAFGIVVEKLHHRLTVFERKKDGRYEVVKSYRAITGKNPGNKSVRGDLSTPEGVYFITGKIDGNKLPPKYGNMAFTLDYPNIYDKQQRKSGYGIWIHATDKPNRLLKPFDTEGCVAVSNEDIDDLQKYLVYFETPVVITKEITTVASDTELERPRFHSMAMINAWKTSWEQSEFESYLGFYSEDFKALKMNKQAWAAHKKNLSFVREGKIKVSITEPKIIAFEDQLLVVFLQHYKARDKDDFGRKFLYLKWEGDRYRIISEKWYPAPRPQEVSIASDSPESSQALSERWLKVQTQK